MYVRITRLYPIAGMESELMQQLGDYLIWLRDRPGFVLGVRLIPTDFRREIARLMAWDDKSCADAAASTEHALAARSGMMALTEDLTIHEEEFKGHLVGPRGAAARAA